MFLIDCFVSMFLNNRCRLEILKLTITERNVGQTFVYPISIQIKYNYSVQYQFGWACM